MDTLPLPAADETMFVWSYPTREQWLRVASHEMASWLPEVGEQLDPHIAPAMCGWPKGRHGAGRAIGECYHPGAMPKQEHLRPIFICPTLDNPVEVLATLLHELVHAALPAKTAHKKRFKDAVFGLGLAGKATATFCEEGTPLYHRLQALIERLGPYPHSAMALRRQVKKGGGWPRYKSTEIEGYKVLVSPKMLEEHGPPLDPLGFTMIPNDAEPEEG